MGSDPSNNHAEPLPMNHPHVTFAYIKHMWTSGDKSEAFKYVFKKKFYGKFNDNDILFFYFSHLNSLIHNVLPLTKRKGKENEKLRHDSTKKLLAR